MPPEEFDTPSTQHDPPEPSTAAPKAVHWSRFRRSTNRLSGSAGYGSAPFLAQLVATKDQHPQTRERRRAEPDMASAAYRAAAALTAA